MTFRCLAAPLLVACAVPVAAQQSDSTKRPAIVLPAVQVTGSIAPVAGPAVGSGIPASVATIGGDRLAAWRPRLLTDVLTSLPDVSSTDDLGSPKKITLGLRGFSVGPTVGNPAGLSVFLDGVRQNEPDAQEVNFDLLPMDAVQRIEVLTGPASLLGPNGLGGAINLITKRGGGPPGATLEIGGGSFGRAEASLSSSGQLGGTWNYYGDFGGERADGWRAASSERASHAFANLSRVAGDRGVSVQGYFSQSRAGTAGSLPESIFDASPRVNFTAGDVDDIDLEQLAVSAFTSLASGRASFTTYLRRSYADRFNANQPPDPDVRGLTDNLTQGASADWRRSFDLPRTTVEIRGGLDASLDQVHVRLFDVTRGAAAPDSLATDVVSHRAALAAYAVGDLVAGRFTLSAGLRADDIHSPLEDRLDRSDSAHAVYKSVTPRAGLSVNLGRGAVVYMSAARSFRPPALVESGCADPSAACPLPFALGDDPPLTPVRATTYEAGARWLLGNTLLDASLYRTAVRDEIMFVASPASIVAGYFTNVPRTRREGGEIDASGFITPRVAWSASYAVSRVTFENAEQLFSLRSDDDFADSRLAGPNLVEPGDELPLIPRSQFKAGANVDFGRGLSAGFDARRIGSQWLRGDEANETAPLTAYTVADARASLERDRWGLSIVVHNLLDNHAPSFGTFNVNRQTGELERFLTPLEARSVRLTVRRQLGASEDDKR